MIKLLCLDLDGTVLNSEGEISNKNILAIRKAIKNGIKVVIVSGRPNCFASMIANKIDPSVGYITFNGAFYKLGDNEKYFSIPKIATKKIAELAKKYNVRTFFKNRNLSLCTKSDPKTLNYDDFRDETPVNDRMDLYYNVDIVDYLAHHDFEVLKILTWDDEYLDMQEEVLNIEGINVFCHEHEGYFELCSSETNKGKAIQNLVDNMEIDIEEVMAIGDSFNDISMFEVVGTSIAMGNAPDKIKEITDYVTKSNDENGVAEVINKVLAD